MKQLNQNIFIAGCGAVAQCFLALLFKTYVIPAKRIKVVDPLDKRPDIAPFIEQGVIFEQVGLTTKNFEQLLAAHLRPGDIFVDVANQVDTSEILQWCRIHGIHYLNTSLNNWPEKELSPIELYQTMRQIARDTTDGATAVVSHGANPGLISSFVKQGLMDLAHHILETKAATANARELKQAIVDHNFADISFLTGVKVVHITENDTHFIARRKKPNEFFNTWSVVEFITEANLPAQFAWGSHEKTVPEKALLQDNAILLATKALHTTLTSWLPDNKYLGITPPHDEAFSIADYLTYHKSTPIHRPTVVFVYQSCPVSRESLQDLEKGSEERIDYRKVLREEIVGGEEKMGCLIMGDFGAWWTGSIVPLDNARSIIPNQNGTILQVAAGVLAGLDFMIEHPNKGILMPEQLDHRRILATARPYLGEFLSQPSDWRPKKELQFQDFLSKKPLM